jgi:hypothetical protein
MKTPEASLSVLMMSLASSAAMAMGLSPHPDSGETSKDRNMAKFNIDLLLVLQAKTKGNLTGDEEKFLSHVIQDLQMKFVEMK